MRIVVLNYEFPPLGGGGGKSTQQLCEECGKLGLFQIVITSWFPGLRFQEVVGEDLYIIRIPTLRLKKYRATVLTMATYIIMALIPLLWICWRYKPHLIHAYFLMPVAPLAWLTRQIFGIPYIVTLQGGDVPGVDSKVDTIFKLLGRIPQQIAQKASRIVAVSEGLREQAVEKLKTSVDYIPNGITDEWIFSQQKPVNNILRLIYVGRLVISHKNVDELLDAVERLPEHISWQFDIFGDGPDRATLEQKARMLPKANHIYFHGWVKEKDIMTALRKSDIFLLPSTYEGLSLAALQAMASGCALVLSNIPANRSLVKEGVNGYFCDFHSQSIAQAVIKCTSDLSEFRKNSVEMAYAFRYEVIAQSYLKIYRTEGLGLA